MEKPPRILCAMLAGLGLLGCRATPTAPATLPTPDAQGVYRLTTDELFDSYRKEGKATDQFLRGKTIVVNGYVVRRYCSVTGDKAEIKRDGPTGPSLYLHVNHESNGFWLSSDGVVCTFLESARKPLRTLLKKLGEREHVTVRGVVGRKLGSIYLSDCSLEPPAH